MTYKKAEQYLLNIPRFTKKNPLENTKAFIRKLGEGMPALKKKQADDTSGFTPGKGQTEFTGFEHMEHVIHVAGTNGKGSVCAYLNGILTKAGYKTGMFTSPHLVTMRERFRINGTPISEELFTKAFHYVKEKTAVGIKEQMFEHPTFFEFLTGMAFVIFYWETVDFILLETGLGGRLDATNVIKKPLACIITSISYDHTNYLGTTIEEIAKEKAGIVKEGVPVIFDGENEAASKVIAQIAAKKNVKTCKVTMKNCKNIIFGKKTIDFLLNSEYDNNMQIRLKTSARYQIINAALAAVAIQTIDRGRKIPSEKVISGLKDVHWPGRMEWLEDSFLIDGAHNEGGMAQAIASVKQMDRNVILVYAAVDDKNYVPMIRMLCEKLPLAGVVVAQLSTPRAVDVEELGRIFRQYYNGFVCKEQSVRAAVAQARKVKKEDELIFGTGSLYLAGEVLADKKSCRKNEE